MTFSHFTPESALVGGILIGLAASLSWVFNGRITGVSGMLAGLVVPRSGALLRVLFLAGLVGAGGFSLLLGSTRIRESPRSVVVLAVAGLLVGFGTRLSGGCTSGHGVCGISRLSPRSLVATAVFMVTGMITVTLFRIWSGQP